ncbi:MAG TPA: hypothetical protein VF932_16995 [Anaerolineae bacterium]
MLDLHPVAYEKLVDYAAGDLALADSAHLDTHVARCARCCRTVVRYRMMRQILCVHDRLELLPALTLARAQALFRHYHRVPFFQLALERLSERLSSAYRRSN